MPTLFVPAQLRDLTDGQDRLEIDEMKLGDIIREFNRRHPGVIERLCVGDELAPALQVSVDQHLTRDMATQVPSMSEIHFLPAIGGG